MTAVLNFDEARYRRIQGGAVALAGSLTQAVKASLEAGAGSLFFLGTGGAAILMQPAAWLMSRHSKLDVVCDLSAELVLAGHPRLGPKSIVVIPSLSGTTKESIEALHFCRATGATVLTLVGHAGTPLHDEASGSFVNFAEDDTSCESFYIQSLLIALAAMNARGEFPGLDRTVAELALLPDLLIDAKRSFEAKAATVA